MNNTDFLPDLKVPITDRPLITKIRRTIYARRERQKKKGISISENALFFFFFKENDKSISDKDCIGCKSY